MSRFSSFRRTLSQGLDSLARLEDLAPQIEELTSEAIEVVRSGGTIFFCGNGGSAAQAQHFATEMLGRFGYRKPPLPGVALTADTAVLTALANDLGFEEVFAMQIRARARAGDLVLALSTSGRSENVVRGLRAAREAGCRAVALLGGDGGRAKESADLAIVAPGIDSAAVQEAHLVIGHYLLARIDRELGE